MSWDAGADPARPARLRRRRRPPLRARPDPRRGVPVPPQGDPERAARAARQLARSGGRAAARRAGGGRRLPPGAGLSLSGRARPRRGARARPRRRGRPAARLVGPARLRAERPARRRQAPRAGRGAPVARRPGARGASSLPWRRADRGRRLSEADRVLVAAVDCSRVNDDERLEAHAVVERLFLRIQVDTERAMTEARELGGRLRVIRGQRGRPWFVQAVAASRADALAGGEVPGGGRRLGAGSRIRSATETTMSVPRSSPGSPHRRLSVRFQSERGSVDASPFSSRCETTGGRRLPPNIRSPAFTR